MSGTQLTVTLSGGGADDARAVVRALEDTFGAPDELPADENATVHMATFGGDAEAGAPSTGEGAGRLSAPVTVTVQGTPEAVRRASDTLTRAFTARDDGAASGDQEQERQLLLVP
ncbi:hypothetical protein [Streptomyces lomondensis]|uniref:Uncharacterized protein n=1 Tax=Streptomyces lomondensis TaxID=68229 RepID=A0ABQ2XU18_9ACTN|nr:hypothetical protein [Streptomyces lomondensis]MCF0082843.1 hypothetical protein [Streptomyces lomondensis]GGX34219.1 hypothetical protein GCM10010383_75650 [Streptomyces lomondensis]